MTEGKKFDFDKDRWDLIQPLSIREYVKILTEGARKYEPYNWRNVEPRKSRYFAALMRHVWAWVLGEQFDQEDGHHHLAHAMCCLTFLMEPELKLSSAPPNDSVLEKEFDAGRKSISVKREVSERDLQKEEFDRDHEGE